MEENESGHEIERQRDREERQRDRETETYIFLKKLKRFFLKCQIGYWRKVKVVIWPTLISWAPNRLLKMNVAGMAFNGAMKNCLL